MLINKDKRNLGNLGMKISVIVSVYNHAVEYLRECLSSLSAQTLEDIEFIIVDNAATAESKEVIKEFEQSDTRFKVIHLTENKGYGRALNIGLKAATGEYVAFVESDDYVSVDAYKNFATLIKNSEFDIIKGLFNKFGQQQEVLGIKFDHRFYNKPLSPHDIPEYPLKYGSFWSAIYKNDFLKNNKILFDEILKPSGEDVTFILRTFLYAKSIYITPHIVYNYRVDNPNSSIRKKDSKVWGLLNLYSMLEKFIEERGDEIDTSLLGVKTKREFLNFYWAYKAGDINKLNLPIILRYSKLFRYNLKKCHYNAKFFNEKEEKIYLQAANHPIIFFIKGLLYKKKITDSHEKRYLFGVQYYAKRLKITKPAPLSQNNFRQSIMDLILSTWITSGATDELMERLKFLSQSRYTMKNLREELMYIYMACLLEKGKTEDALKILMQCKEYYKFKDLHRYIYVSDFCLQNGISTENSIKSTYIAQCFDKNMNSGILENYLRGKSIAVVGNSGCELGLGKGAEIDAHDVVIRFGNYPLEYTKDYGCKTNIWVRAFGANASDVEKRDMNEYDFVLWNHDFKHYFIQFDSFDYMYESFLKYPQKHVFIGAAIRRKLYNKTFMHLPTSGALTIYYLLEILGSLKTVDAYGFAFLNNDANDTIHYYDKKCRICADHSFKSEVDFLHKLYAER